MSQKPLQVVTTLGLCDTCIHNVIWPEKAKKQFSPPQKPRNLVTSIRISKSIQSIHSEVMAKKQKKTQSVRKWDGTSTQMTEMQLTTELMCVVGFS